MLRDLVAFKSVESEPKEGMPFGEEVDKAYRYMLDRANADGFDVFDADGYGGHIEWTGVITDEKGVITAAADEAMGIPVHLDVMPAAEGWTYDPWGGEISDGRVYGRGTLDNKGAAVAVYYAMKALKDSGFVPARNVRLILGLDEERGWTGMDKYLEKTTPPDFGFAPDGDFPVVNGEKGLMIFEIAKKLEQGRESGLFLRGVKGGTAPNMVPDRCRAILAYEEEAAGKEQKSKKPAGRTKGKAAAKNTEARDKAFCRVREAVAHFRERTGRKLSCKGTGNALEVSSQGISAHGAAPHKGVNAISVMMEFLSGLPLANESARDFVDFYYTRIGYETNGESLGLCMSDAESGSLIFNAGMIDLRRDAAILTVNIRHPVTKSEDDIYDALRPALEENGLGVVKLKGLAPLYFAPDDPYVELLMDIYRKNTGDEESKPIIFGGGTYARAIPRAVAYGLLFPDDEEVMHQKDEYIKIDSLMKAAHIYADAISRLTEDNGNTLFHKNESEPQNESDSS